MLASADLSLMGVVEEFEEQQIPLQRVLTERGTEYCGAPERHEYELYLAVELANAARLGKLKGPRAAAAVEAEQRRLRDQWEAASMQRSASLWRSILSPSTYSKIADRAYRGRAFGCEPGLHLSYPIC